MTSYTNAELATRVLRDLGLISADETPSAVDLSHAEDTCNSVIARLGVLGVPIWNGDSARIPLEYLTVLAKYIGLEIAPSYGLSDLGTAAMAQRELQRDLIEMAAPHGSMPLAARTDDAKPANNPKFNFTLGW